MKPTVKVSWSGGKDSTCAVLLHLEMGHKVKAVNYTPMFTEEIPLLLKEHYEFIQNTAERFRDMGEEVYIVTGMTYYDFVLRKKTKGADKRDGCTLCPNAPKREREQWFREFPESIPLVKELQDKVKAEKPKNHTPLRNHEWFL